MTTRTAASIALTALLSLAATAGAQEWIAIEVQDGVVSFPATIEGTSARAMLNTSAPNDSIDAAFARQLGLTLSGKRQRVRSALGGGAIVPSEAELDVVLFGEKIALRDVAALEHPATPLQLGAKFLEPFVVQIDYPGTRMRLLPRAALDLRDRANVRMRAAEGSCTRARTQNLSRDISSGPSDFAREGFGAAASPRDDTPCLPTVRATFPGDKELWLLLDTGAAGPVVVGRSVAERAGWLAAYARGETESFDVFGRRVPLDLLVLPSLRLGPFELGGVPVAVPAAGERAFSGQENWGRVTTGTHVSRGARASGRLGYDALRHFIVTIDFKRELMQIERPAAEVQ